MNDSGYVGLSDLDVDVFGFQRFAYCSVIDSLLHGLVRSASLLMLAILKAAIF